MIVPILKTNEYNANGVYVPKELIEDYLKDLDSTNILCEMEPEFTVSLENVSHAIVDLFLKDDYLMADIDIFNTPKGKILQDMVDDENLTVDFPSCYICDIKEEGDKKVVTSISNIKCFVSVDGLAFT